MKLFGSSGIRAPFTKDLLHLAFRVGLAVGKNYHEVVVGTDTRTTAGAMKHALSTGLLAAGARCTDAGITPTPTLAFVTREFTAGVMITASHNPPEYNGIKLLNPDGSSFDSLQQIQVEEAVTEESYDIVGWEDVKQGEVYAEAVNHHISRILPDFPRAAGIKVVVDAGCGAASLVTPRLLERMGCEVITLNCYNSGFFPRPAEPVEANLKELRDTVRESGAAIGIAHDGDGDRMMAIDETGRFISGDTLLAIFASREGMRDVVTTLDASMAIDEMGLTVRRTRIGDTRVSEELRHGGDFGGETSGCWIFPEISLSPDGIYAAALITRMAAGRKLSELADSLPSYPLLRQSVNGSIGPLSRVEEEMTHLKPVSVDDTDGLKLNFKDGWILVRPSGTEPKVRLTAEAKTEERAQYLMDAALAAVNHSVTAGGASR